jgi:glycosyltransferase involved in cell wall biosynthesis
MVDLEKEPYFDKQILVICARMLTPDIDAGSLRTYHLLTILRDLSYHVTFIASFPFSWPPYTSSLETDTIRLRERGIKVPSDSTTNSVEGHLQQSGRLYDVVILGGEYVAAKHIANVRQYAPQATILFDTGDIHYLRHYREAKVTGNVRALKRALRTKKRELAAAKQADYTLVVSPIEKAILEKECPGIQVHVISSIHKLHGSAKPFSERKDILFIGSFQHAPNLDAVSYLMDEIYPLIRRKIIGIKLYIIGSDPPVSIKNLNSSDVIVTGYVPDLASYFDNCRLSVAPLRFGAGVKGKVLTSTSYGVPVVASSVAAEGMYLTDGQNVLVADDHNDFCNAVVTLYQNETLWNHLSRNGLDIISQRFSFAAVRAALLELLTNIE